MSVNVLLFNHKGQEKKTKNPEHCIPYVFSSMWGVESTLADPRIQILQ